MEAIVNGYVEGIALDVNGFVSEASGANLFVVRKGKLMTPPLGNSVLPGITRVSILALAEDIGLPVVEQMIPREMLYIADEVFFCGTASEITPIKSIDKIAVADGKTGPVTLSLQREFFGIVNGTMKDRHNWFTQVPVKAKQAVGV
jgi:branched-chain amino acid aminotransferase